MPLMRIDCSEVKSYKECARKWSLTSRNKFHLKPKAPNPNFMFGTLFHEGLHAMYMGGTVDKALDTINRELSDPVMQRCITTMLTGYAIGPLVEDLLRYRVIDIEHSFTLHLDDLPDIELCGSIDMIVEEISTGLIFGFEHKSAKSFRPDIYTKLDEQPRLYIEALYQWCTEHGYGPERVGGIYINQVKKVQKYFDYQRDLCMYTASDRAKFMGAFKITCLQIYTRVNSDEAPTATLPEPGYMKCQMCDFSNICEHYGYTCFDLPSVLSEFEEEYAVRECDHLEEKQERHKEE